MRNLIVEHLLRLIASGETVQHITPHFTGRAVIEFRLKSGRISTMDVSGIDPPQRNAQWSQLVALLGQVPGIRLG